MPVTEYDTDLRLAEYFLVVDFTAVCVAVDHHRDPVLGKCICNCLLADINDVFRLKRGVRYAATAQVLRQVVAGRQGQGEEQSLPHRAACPAPETLVGAIMRAQLITVRDQHPGIVEFDDGRCFE